MIIDYFMYSQKLCLSQYQYHINYQLDSNMDIQLPQMKSQDFLTFQNYITHFWLFLQIDQHLLSTQLQSEKNQLNVMTFVKQHKTRFMVLQKTIINQINIQLQWAQDMSSARNILLIKKHNFNLFSGITQHQITQMIKVINLDFQNQPGSFSVTDHYFNQLMKIIFGFHCQDYEKRQDNNRNTFMKDVISKLKQLNHNFDQCQKMIIAPQIILQIHPKVKTIMAQHPSHQYLQCSDLITDQETTEMVQYVVNWNAKIQSLLNEQLNMMRGTTVELKNYYHSFLRSLRNLSKQIQSNEVTFTINTLKNKNKYHQTALFGSLDASVNKKNQIFCEVWNVFKQLPFEEMINANSMSELNQILTSILRNLKKMNEIAAFDEDRVFGLIQMINKDLSNQILKIASQQDIMFCNFNTFKIQYDKTNDIFNRFEEKLSHLAFKQKIKILNYAQYNQKPFKGRLHRLFKIRELYEKLKNALVYTNSRLNKQLLPGDEIQACYNIFKGINVLDISEEGQQILQRVEKQFNKQIESIQIIIRSRLKQCLNTARNIKQMFKTFEKINAMLFRPIMKSLIEEYQCYLLKDLKDQIDSYERKLLCSYSKTQNNRICKIRDIPEIPGKIIWINRIRIELENYQHKIQSIILDNWKDHPEGKSIKQKIEALLKQLNTQQIRRDWDKNTSNIIRSIQLDEKSLFKLTRNNDVAVNFEPKHIEIIKQIKIFEAIQSRTNSVIYAGRGLIELYPFALSFYEAIYFYHQISNKIDENMKTLLVQKKKLVMILIDEGFQIKWNILRKVERYSKSLAEAVFQFDQLYTLVSQKCQKINQILESMNNCPFHQKIFSAKLNIIQKHINELLKNDVSNLHIWVSALNQRIQPIFALRVEAAIDEWVHQFQNYEQNQKQGTNSHIKQGLTHILKSQNNLFFFDPPLEQAKFTLMQELHRIIGVLFSLPRLEANQYQKSLENDEIQDKTYQNSLHKINPQIINKAYDVIFKTFNNAKDCQKQWFNFPHKILWTIDSKVLINNLGDDISEWQNLFSKIRQNKKMFDNEKNIKYFGPIIIDYRLVFHQTYNTWYKQIIRHVLSRFGNTQLRQILL